MKIGSSTSAVHLWAISQTTSAVNIINESSDVEYNVQNVLSLRIHNVTLQFLLPQAAQVHGGFQPVVLVHGQRVCGTPCEAAI